MKYTLLLNKEKRVVLQGAVLSLKLTSKHTICLVAAVIFRSLISNVVSGLVLEELLEFEALDEAVAEAALLSG